MIHHHGTPITPIEALYQLKGRHFCVSHIRPEDVKRCHDIGQSVMLDNGAFSKWKRGAKTNWPAYYDWCDRWLDYRCKGIEPSAHRLLITHQMGRLFPALKHSGSGFSGYTR